MSQRPLSPHVFVYKFMYTMALSILHRVTGCALSVGLLLFIYWLVAAASGAEAYAQAQIVFAHPITKIVLYGFSFAFFYHLMNGVRHLAWDAGYGLERAAARKSGWIAFLGAVVITVFFWIIVLRSTGGAA